MKKLLSLVLVLCMVFGMSVSVFAASAIANDAELAEAIAAGETNLTLGEGTFHMPAAAKGKTLTITGAGASTIIEVVPAHPGSGEGNGQPDYNLDGSTVTFNDLTIKTNGQTYAGFVRMSATYNNCIIDNTYMLYGDSTFDSCTFQTSGDTYNVWTYGSNATFTGCTFNSDGKSVLIYTDGAANSHSEVSFANCTFNATQAVEGKAAIEIGTYNGNTFTVNIDDCEANGFADGSTSGNPLWNMKNEDVSGDINGVYNGSGAQHIVNAGQTTPNTDPTVPVVTPEPEIPVAKEETYKSVVSASIENGSVKVDSKKATRGEKVTIIVTPDKGYELAALSVIDEDGNERKVTENEDGTFSFRMPEGGVTIEAEFAKIGASTSTPSTEKENPSTGASDFVGAAAALAVVSVMGMAALSIKR